MFTRQRKSWPRRSFARKGGVWDVYVVVVAVTINKPPFIVPEDDLDGEPRVPAVCLG